VKKDLDFKSRGELHDLFRERSNTALAIRDALEAVKDHFGYWEKANLAHAIATLAWNVRSGQQEYDGWLRLSLVSVELALAHPATRNENYAAKDPKIEAFAYIDLQRAIDQLIAECRAGPEPRR
jgi:hypothetical protein